MSDRAIAGSAGLSAKTVSRIRQRSTDAEPQLTARVGRDGRVRPLDSTQGRRRAAELLAQNPDASLREVARKTGVSPATASDVRRRLDRGEEPVLLARRDTRHSRDNAARPGNTATGRALDIASAADKFTPSTVDSDELQLWVPADLAVTSGSAPDPVLPVPGPVSWPDAIELERVVPLSGNMTVGPQQF